jgi:hypothetical protein
MSAGPYLAAGLCTTVIGAVSTYRSDLPSGWQTQTSNRRSAASATRITIRSPTRSMGLYKAEVIHLDTDPGGLEAVELATLQWVDCIGNTPPAEAEKSYNATLEQPAMAA